MKRLTGHGMSVILTSELYNRLKEYEDAEEAGLLVRLPCKVGDVVYAAFEDEDVLCGEVYAISTCDGTNWFSVRYDCGLRFDHKWCEIGKIVFFTREEAEAALAKRRL
jgi:hypothetical protein